MDETTEKAPDFDEATLEKMNEKAIQNQFFTPDYVYLDLTLFKDISLGCVYMEQVYLKDDRDAFREIQRKLVDIIPAYQKRLYDTTEPFLGPIGYSDAKIDALLQQSELHDYIFSMSPATKFLDTLIRHTIRNQNNSRPANKYTKHSISEKHYAMEPVPITYRINTWPLTLSNSILQPMAEVLGESFGVNIVFMNKDPLLFDAADWDEWMEKVDGFYLNDLGRWNRGDFVLQKQGDMQFAGIYVFARKRFERHVIAEMHGVDFEQEIQVVTAQLAMFCDFEWLQNNDVRLTEETEDVPMNEDETPPSE